MIGCYQFTLREPRGEGLLFDGASFEVDDGEWAEIVGPAGAGKSLICGVVALEYRPVEGRFVIGGRNLERLDSEGLLELRRRVGCCRQPPEFLEGRTAFENLVAPLVVRGETGEARARGESLLERAGLADRADVPVGELAAGERRLLGVLRATVGEPEIIVIDGALEALSGAVYDAAERALKTEADRGGTVLVFGRQPGDVTGVDGTTFQISGGAIQRKES